MKKTFEIKINNHYKCRNKTMYKLIMYSYKFIIFTIYIYFILSLDYNAQNSWPGVCATGLKMQSPINIETSKLEKDNSKFSFESIDYSTITSTKIGFVHEYSVSTPDLDNGNIKVKINGTDFTYKLKNIHFHLNSEHSIDGKLYDIEMHVVHENTNSNDEQNLHMVIGYIFKAEGDTDNEFLKSIGFNTGETVINVQVQNIVKKENVYYYKGGLTTPPCTEDVNWVVVQDIKTMSTSQLAKFKTYITSLDSTYANGNNRNVQQLYDRKVYKVDLEGENEDQESENEDQGNGNYLKIHTILISLFIVILI